MQGENLTEDHNLLLQTLYRTFHREAEWPTYQYVDKALDAADIDLATTLTDIPDDLVITTRSGGASPQPGDPIRLTLSGVSEAGGTDDIDLFLRVLGWLAEQERGFQPSDPSQAEEIRITSEEIHDAVLPDMPVEPLQLTRLFRLIELEPTIYSTLKHPDNDGDWELVVSPRIRRFRGVRDIDQYLEFKRSTSGGHPRPAGFPPIAMEPQLPTPELRDATDSRLSHLHPGIRQVGEALFLDGHLASAIFEAFKAVEIRVRDLSRLDVSGRDLMARAFRETDRHLPLNEGATRVDRDEQEGFKLIFMGAIQGIRNPKAHDNLVQEDIDRAHDYLSLASLLMRRLDDVENLLGDRPED